MTAAAAIAIYSYFLAESVGIHLSYKLGAAFGTEFGQHVFAVVGYRVVADEELAGNLFGTQALGNAVEYLPLAGSEAYAQRCVWCGGVHF